MVTSPSYRKILERDVKLKINKHASFGFNLNYRGPESQQAFVTKKLLTATTLSAEQELKIVALQVHAAGALVNLKILKLFVLFLQSTNS